MTLDEKALEAAIEAYKRSAGLTAAQFLGDAITAYLRALCPGSTGEAEGWVLVPKEPREEQIEAMRLAYRNARRAGVCGMTIDAQFRAEYAPELAAYRAMLAAAGGKE